MSIDNDKLNSLVWAEKYRPKKLEDAILPESTKKMIRDLLDSGNIPHFLFTGTAGTGKTTLARIIANELDADLMYINASLEGIDAVRLNVIQFSSSVSFGDGIKIVLLDEFDGASAQQQQSLRGVIEQFPNTRFIFTCNFKNKVMDAIHSRCQVIDFKVPKTEIPKLQAAFFKRVITILETENIEYDKPAVAELVKKFYPDFRSTLNALQSYSSSGKIDTGILVNQTDALIEELAKHLKVKNFTEMRKWVGNYNDMEPEVVFRGLYDKVIPQLDPRCVPSVIVTLGDYMYKCSQVADTEVLVAAALTHFMSEAVWNS